MDVMKLRCTLDRERRRTRLTLSILAVILVISLLPPYAAADRYSGPRHWEVHAAIMGLAGLLFVLTPATSLLRLLKVEWRPKAHMVIGGLAVGLAITGTAFGFWMLEWAGRSHIMTHSVAGYVGLAFLLAPLASGIVLAQSKRDESVIRWVHIILGIASIVAMVIAGILGAHLAQ